MEKINEVAATDELGPGREPDVSTDPSSLVAESTASKVRTFLYEIAQGTTNYRSLHSLTQQVEHQYHGRFLIELIQNAHDALFEEAGTDRGRITVCIVDSDGPFGALYIANDGWPISRSNFTSLSQLGQSDKDPQKSIGNKGIGFRSVLEITDSPQIFSRHGRESSRFDGLCFGFSPLILEKLKRPINELAIDGRSPASPIGTAPLVDWDIRLIEKFRKAVGAKESEWLAKELTYLSPYLLPVPLSADDAPERVKMFERDGYATVIRLPLKSEVAREAVKERVAQLPSDTVLFLDRVSTLILDEGGTVRRLTRDVTRYPASRFHRQAVAISGVPAAQPESYLIWERTIRVVDAPAKFREALLKLPGKWPELTEARVAIAVRVGARPASGLFSVFLPTMLKTGSSAHVNGPFFADMSRTDIDFEKQDYNCGLLAQVWKLAVEIARDELAGVDVAAADALIDLLAPTGVEPAAQRWRKGVLAALADAGLDFSEQEWFPTSDGAWSSLSITSLLPVVPDGKVFTEPMLRAHATFSVFDAQLHARETQLAVLADMAGYKVAPSKVGLAETIEAVTKAVHAKGDVDWNSFWLEVQSLLEGEATHLIGRRVLIGVDDQLHAAGDECAVFFIPRHGAGEDDDVVSESAIIEIPPCLQPSVAFLHSSITLYDTSNLRQQTQTRKFLEKTLVNRFRVEDIFNEVLIKRTPALPAKLKGDESDLCADILHWGLGLLSNLAGRGRGDKTIRMLKDLALPCRGGWFKAGETSFGSGWPAHLGSTLQRYLLSAKTDDCREAAKRLLLPARHALWREVADRHVELLDTAGVATGLRVDRVDPSDWNSTFSGIQGAFDLPTTPPPHYSAPMWGRYRSWVRDVRVPYGGSTHNYQVQHAFLVPGLSDFERFDNSTRTLLMQLLLGSMASWPIGWDLIECKKMSGNPGPVTVKSPLWYALHQLPWVGVHQRDQLSWRPPSHHWHVPAKLLGTRAWQFEHLRPLPMAIAHLLDQSKGLVSVLAGLGTHQYDPEAKSNSTALLDALAHAAESSELRDPNSFLGQVRGAWTCFTPGTNQVFPKKLIVSRSGRRLEAVVPSRDSPVYLPDSSRSSLAALDQFDIPVVAIDASDAKRVTAAVVAAYGAAVIPTSALRVVPIADGAEWAPRDLLRIHESTLNWIAPMALTLAAYFGPNQRGTGSQRFAAQLQALREVNVAWCKALAVALFHGEHKVAQPETVAVWIPESKTLLLTSACETEPRLISESLASILERDDLEVALKCVLRETAADNLPAILGALADLKLSEAQFLEVREQWTGNLRYLVDQLMPLVLLLKPHVNPQTLLEQQTEEQLSAFITTLGAGEFDGQQLLSLAREFPDLFEFGWQCYQRFGNVVGLPHWNQAIVRCGGKPVCNRQAEEEFSSHVARARSLMRSLLVFLVARQAPAKTFRELLAELDGTGMPPDFADTRWEVQFADVWSAVAPLAGGFGDLPGCQLSAFPESAEALAAELSAIGVAVELDPVRLARDNRDRLKQGLARLQQIGLAWALTNDRPKTAPWETSPESLIVALDDALATNAYLQPWSELEVLMLMRCLPHIATTNPVSAAVESATSLSELQTMLGVSDGSIVGAAEQLRDMKDQARRQRRLVDVCGHEFDGDEDNLGSLWAHICESLPDDNIAGMPSINLAKPVKLGVMPPRRSRGRRGGVATPAPAPRAPRSIDMLIGMAGEIHAFRRLQSQYGAAVVTSSSWISGISVSAFPENASFADDGAGCDFRFMTAEGSMFHIEVKSSGGGDESFTLGSSEIRLAMELARPKRRRQKDRFVILRVLNSMSSQPTFQVLPNPYDGRYTALFDIVEAGARVRYSLAASD